MPSNVDTQHIDRDLFDRIDLYIDGLFAPPDPALEAAVGRTAAQSMPDIQVSAGQGKFLYLMAKLTGARRSLGRLAAIQRSGWRARCLLTAGW